MVRNATILFSLYKPQLNLTLVCGRICPTYTPWFLNSWNLICNLKFDALIFCTMVLRDHVSCVYLSNMCIPEEQAQHSRVGLRSRVQESCLIDFKPSKFTVLWLLTTQCNSGRGQWTPILFL